KITANEGAAQAALKTIATSAETYATGSNGTYPTAEGSLKTGTIPYYNRTFCTSRVQGYSFGCTWASTGYTIVATPASGQTGTRTFTITTGGILTTP
ncbi:MAG: hypothetical protein Q8O13_01625, partial [Candidatus Omnitrophota bacterium]|nr:hypothetical protein [Candidatus Omnitrophota bacterium]